MEHGEIRAATQQPEGEREKTNRPFAVEIVRGFDARFLESILEMERVCYPREWQYDDAAEYYEALLRSESAIHIFLRDGDRMVGYLLGRPLSEVYEELKAYDAELHNDPSCYYLETIGVRPECAGRRGGMTLLKAFRESVKKREGYDRLSAHARKAPGSDLSSLLRKIHPDAAVRFVPRWFFGGDEPYDYIVWNIS